MKSIVIISDLHCGNTYGLTPPEHQTEHKNKMKIEAWDAYAQMAQNWRSPDILLVNGDCIDGNQPKMGGAELITCDRNTQVDIAVKCILKWDAKKILMTYGTAYHTGNQAEDFEYSIADKCEAKIEGRLFFNVEGLTFDARHKVGSSGIPHGRATPLLKEMMWNLMKEAEETGPKIDVIVRSHVHYHLWIESGNRIMFTTPALQLSRGRYGSRECSGITHWGAIRLIVDKGQIIRKDVKIWNLLANYPQVMKIR